MKKRVRKQQRRKKYINRFIGAVSFGFIIASLSELNNFDNYVASLILGLFGLVGLFITAYNAGWLYSYIYERDKREWEEINTIR